MTHAVIIRMHYPENDKRFDWRLSYFKSMVLPRLLKQTDKDFDIAVRCNPWHEKQIKELSDRIITFSVKNESERIKVYRNKKYFIDFVDWKDVIGLKQYDIQSGLDSDDLISLDYIQRVKAEIKANPNQSLHISFQPRLFNVLTLKNCGIGTRYNSNKGSAFLSIYQPIKDNYKFVYEESHLTIGRHFEKSIILPEGFCWASVHGLNESTGV